MHCRDIDIIDTIIRCLQQLHIIQNYVVQYPPDMWYANKVSNSEIVDLAEEENFDTTERSGVDACIQNRYMAFKEIVYITTYPTWKQHGDFSL